MNEEMCELLRQSLKDPRSALKLADDLNRPLNDTSSLSSGNSCYRRIQYDIQSSESPNLMWRLRAESTRINDDKLLEEIQRCIANEETDEFVKPMTGARSSGYTSDKPYKFDYVHEVGGSFTRMAFSDSSPYSSFNFNKMDSSLKNYLSVSYKRLNPIFLLLFCLVGHRQRTGIYIEPHFVCKRRFVFVDTYRGWGNWRSRCYVIASRTQVVDYDSTGYNAKGSRKADPWVERRTYEPQASYKITHNESRHFDVQFSVKTQKHSVDARVVGRSQNSLPNDGSAFWGHNGD
jgi:hypothetical protein